MGLETATAMGSPGGQRRTVAPGGYPPSPAGVPVLTPEQERVLLEHLPIVRFLARRIHERLPPDELTGLRPKRSAIPEAGSRAQSQQVSRDPENDRHCRREEEGRKDGDDLGGERTRRPCRSTR